jgi:hypothetical protein
LLVAATAQAAPGVVADLPRRMAPPARVQKQQRQLLVRALPSPRPRDGRGRPVEQRTAPAAQIPLGRWRPEVPAAAR